MKHVFARRRWWLVAASLAAFAALALVQGAAGASKQPGSVTLSVQFSGDGAGTVTQTDGPGTGTPQGINCTTPNPGLGNVCSESFPFGAPPQPWVQLTASAPPGSQFVSWTVSPSEDADPFSCGLEDDCYVQMNDDVTVTANFQQFVQQVPLEVTMKGSGANLGVVTSNPSGINCNGNPSDCSTSFPTGTSVTLSASTKSGATFAGWGGACSFAGTSPQCNIVVNSATKVTANFNAPQVPLSVSVTGSGGVSSSPPAISCPTTCQASFAQGSQVVLYATPASNYQFTGWGGACSGQGTCTLTLSSATTVTATFALITQSLSVTVEGSGKVTSSPAGVSCPTDCSGSFGQGTQVTLTATPAPGYQFGGWSGGGCGASPTCTVTMSQAQTVSATFTRAPVQANFLSATVRLNGPSYGRRTLTIVTSNQQVVGVNIKVRKGSSQVKNLTYRAQSIGNHSYTLLMRNVTPAGRYVVTVAFTNVARTIKRQVKGITLPPVPKS